MPLLLLLPKLLSGFARVWVEVAGAALMRIHFRIVWGNRIQMQETHLNCKDAVCCPTEPTLGSAGIPALGSVGDVDVEPVGLVLESDIVVENRQSEARSRTEE